MVYLTHELYASAPMFLLLTSRLEFRSGHCECTRSGTRGQLSKSGAICEFPSRHRDGAAARLKQWKAASDAAFDCFGRSLMAIETGVRPAPAPRLSTCQAQEMQSRSGAGDGRLVLLLSSLLPPHTPWDESLIGTAITA